MSTLPAASDAVNPQPAFYAIIPASVRYCAALPPSAKLLFGELVALTTVKGYCFAQNPYFVELYGVDRATIKRWLAALAKEGFIKIEFHGRERRIYALAMGLPVAQKCATDGAKMRHHRRKNAPHSITLNNTENNTLLGSAYTSGGFVGPGPVPARELKASEGKVTASPSTVESKSGFPRSVTRAAAMCSDISASGRFLQLRIAVERGMCVDLWQDGLDAVKTARSGSTGILEASTAIFERVLLSGLADRGLLALVGPEGPPASALASAGGGHHPPQ
jgi:hypothetical protein